MKMPRRYFFPMEPPPDIFGLRSLTLIGEACETESERKRRAAKIEAGVGAAFTAATRHLGEAEARELFRRGHPQAEARTRKRTRARSRFSLVGGS
jgi:hypothetical protein